MIIIKIASQSAEGKMTVRIDGNEVDPATLHAPIQLAGGDHVVAVTAPGYAPFSQEVTVKAAGDVQTVDVPILERVVIGRTILPGEHVGDWEHGFVGSITGGLGQDGSGVFSATGGALFRFGRLDLSAGLHLTEFQPFSPTNGVAAAGVGGDVEVRFGIFPTPRLHGLYAMVRGGFLGLFGDQNKHFPTVGSAPPVTVTMHSLMGDVGVGLAWGFPATKLATISVRVSVDQLFFGYDPYFQQQEFPDPHPNPIVISVGLEFVRWRFP
jgi:hypothetical protein